MSLRWHRTERQEPEQREPGLDRHLGPAFGLDARGKAGGDGFLIGVAVFSRKPTPGVYRGPWWRCAAL